MSIISLMQIDDVLMYLEAGLLNIGKPIPTQLAFWKHFSSLKH